MKEKNPHMIMQPLLIIFFVGGRGVGFCPVYFISIRSLSHKFVCISSNILNLISVEIVCACLLPYKEVLGHLGW